MPARQLCELLNFGGLTKAFEEKWGHLLSKENLKHILVFPLLYTYSMLNVSAISINEFSMQTMWVLLEQ